LILSLIFLIKVFWGSFLGASKKLKVILLFIFFLAGFYAHGNPPIGQNEVAPWGGNSDQYNVIQEKLKETPTSQDKDLLKDYKVLFVNGIFTEFFEKIIKVPKRFGFSFSKATAQTFFDQKEFFKARGIPFDVVPVQSSERCDYNAKVIADQIRKERKKIILFTHSKGGVDTLHALIKYPEIQEKIAGWIALNTPFKGTPVADFFSYRTWPRYLANIFVGAIGGGEGTYKCLTQTYRKGYLFRNGPEIRALTDRIPLFSVGSWHTIGPKTGEEAKIFGWGKEEEAPQKDDGFIPLPQTEKSIFGPIIHELYERQGANDGMVPMGSFCMGHGDECLFLSNLDHLGLVMDVGPFKSLKLKKRINLTRTFFYLLFEEIRGR
jgi:triacylglycerol lipase